MMKQVITDALFKYDVVTLDKLSMERPLVAKSRFGMISIVEICWRKNQMRLLSAPKLGLGHTNGIAQIVDKSDIIEVFSNLLSDGYQIFVFDTIVEMYQWLADELKE